MNQVDMHDILCPLPANQNEWCHYVIEQVKRIRKHDATIEKMNDEGYFLKVLNYNRALKDYLLKYIEMGWAEEEGDE